MIVVCHRCGHERELTRAQIVSGRWQRIPCPVCGGQGGAPPVECDCGHVTLAPPDAIRAGALAACPRCAPEDEDAA